MKRRLQLKKETLKTLSADHLEQVAGGSYNDSVQTCDAPDYLMGVARQLINTLPVYPVGTP